MTGKTWTERPPSDKDDRRAERAKDEDPSEKPDRKDDDQYHFRDWALI